MKKCLCLLIMITAPYAALAAAQDNNSFYGGLSVGRSSANVTQITRQDVLDIGFNSITSFQNGSSKSDTAWKIFGGYRFNPNVAAEIFYGNLGKFSHSAEGSGLIGSTPTPFSLESSLKVTGFGAAALIGAPLNEQWSVFAKPGFFCWDAKDTVTATTTSSISGSTDKKGTSPSFGLGAAYAFTENLSARLEWEAIFNVGDKNTTGKSNVNMLALSIQFRP
jgi:OOP family OmpA-OmpF porin